MYYLIDCDPGIDDSLALCSVLLREERTIAGISTVAGNVSAAQGAENVLRLLKLTGHEGEIPVCSGAENPLYGTTVEYPVQIHGRNGLADLELPQSVKKPCGMDVCSFLYETAGRCSGDVTLVTLGRFTNIARTMMKYPDFPDRISRVVSMGGAVFTHGNITPEAEANLYGDPEAARIVFSAPWELTLVGLDVTMKTILSREQICALATDCENQELGSFLTKSLLHLADFIRSRNPMLNGCPLHDPLAMLAALDPTLVQTEKIPVRVECSHSAFRGKITPVSEGHPVRISVEVDATRAIQMLLEGLGVVSA